MKELIEFILLSLILTFVWNSVRRLLFAPKTRQQQAPRQQQQSYQTKSQTSKNAHGLNWDAEEAEYEEIKDENKSGNYGSK